MKIRGQNMSKTLLSGLLIAAVLSVGCQMRRPGFGVVIPSETLPGERAAMQTRVLPVPDDVVFPATVATMQDLGWKLESVDRSSGLIRASTEKRLEPLGPKEEHITNFEWRRATIQKRASEKDQWTRWSELMVHIEKWPGGQTRMRIILTRHGVLPAMSYPSRVERREVIINAPAKEESVEVALGEVYAVLFQQIDKAVTARMTPAAN